MDAMALPVNDRCPVARSLTILGQKWTLLVLREAFFGRTRFAEFSRIGIPSDVLTARLGSLVEAGILERSPYREGGGRVRDEYLLTAAGRDVLPVVAALSQWGREHLPAAEASTMRALRDADDEPVRLAFVDSRGEVVAGRDVVLRRLVG